MTRPPEEPSSWVGTPDPDSTVRLLREQLDGAKARMREHREAMRAAGLTTPAERDGPPA